MRKFKVSVKRFSVFRLLKTKIKVRLIMNDNVKKRRISKTTRNHYELYVEELEKNEAFRVNKFNPANPDVLNESWKKLCNRLNGTGGPCRDVHAWKRVFSDWKAHVRKRAREIKTAYKETGNKGPPEKPLSDIEERLLNATGKIVVEGAAVPEIGLTVEHDPVTEVPTPEAAKPLLVTLTNTARKIPKRSSLLTEVKNLTSTLQSDAELKDINNNLKKLVQIQEKNFNLRVVKLQLKYPNLDISELLENNESF